MYINNQQNTLKRYIVIYHFKEQVNKFIYYTLRFYFPYLSLLAQPVNITFYYTSVYIFYIKLNADKITILHIKIQLLILFK